MTDLQDRLTTLLGDRYEIQREAGRGGMATVYLARDRRHDRRVAIKVLEPDLAAGIGAERFLREIRVAAGLNHPNILPLYDSGEADGLLYYVMPFVDGESVGDRITHHGPLPIDEALQIARQVAAALEYAHRAGVVHRDVKPDNIMLSGDVALVTDFGIAHAMEQTGEQRLTATGYVVGTPAYMSPEQATGGSRIDGRSDIYSLGCVLYTMLIGEPPFSGTTAAATVARHLGEAVPSMRLVRSTIPPVVEAAVHRALAKVPADRFNTAAEFAGAIAPERITADRLASGRWPKAGVKAAKLPMGWAVAALGVMAIVVAVAWWRPWARSAGHRTATLDEYLAAVAPFQIDATVDSGLARLVGAVSQQVVQRLPGDGGPRAVALTTPTGDSRSALRAAQAMGAGELISGNVSALAGRLRINATLTSVAGDSLLAQVDALSGAPDSLAVLLDHMVSELLVESKTTEPGERAALSRLSLPTLRAYFAAYQAFTHGDFERSGDLYEQVLAADSTCFPAAFGMGAVAIVRPDLSKSGYAVRLAEQQRTAFTFSDSLYLRALEWPLEKNVGIADRVARFDHAATAPGAGAVQWFLLGSRLFHDGPLLGLPDVLHRAAASFENALDLEPDFVPALGGAIDLAAGREDTAVVRALARRYFALDSTSAIAGYYHWRVAVALGDRSALRAVRARISGMDRTALERIVNVAQIDGVALPDALTAANALWQQGGTAAAGRWAFIKQRELALNRGRPIEANAILQHWRSTIPFYVRDGLAEVVNALYWGADTTFPARWVREMTHEADQGRWTPGSGEDMALQICGVNLWRVQHGSLAAVPDGLRRLRDAVQRTESPQDMQLCAETIDAELAHRTGAADAGRKLARLDSLAGTAPPVITWLLAAANLTAAQLWEASGNLPNALAAVRRRPYITDVGEPRVLVALSTMLREEGRLAAMTGDTASAVEAYRRYVALRSDAEPSVKPEVDSVRAELARLVKASK
jgi:tRNA A-37 threonylcarbamoyl transferase component Bud32